MNEKISSALKFVQMGWALVPIPPNTKGPNQQGWNNVANTIRTADKVESFWNKCPDWNMGVLLNASNIVVLDVDHVENCRILFDTLGIDYDKTLSLAPRIVGRPGRDKAIFRAPLGVELSRKALSWPNAADKNKTDTIIEFRAGAIQDVLPPSIHPDTQKPYEWRKDPFDSIPDLPNQILTIWTQWEIFKPQMIAACPWAADSQLPIDTPPKKPRVVDSEFISVIDAFNDAHDVESIIEKFGYKRTRGGRYLSPYSSSGIAGVHVFKEQNRIFSHHASEPFDTSHSHDAFDMWCFFEHGGDTKRAVREAADMLGMRPESKFTDEESLAHGMAIFALWQKEKAAPKKDAPPADLLSIPGILQDVVDHYNTTAAKPQPQFAIQAALAFGSVVLGRRFKTNWNNFSSLYFINVGKSGSGKEHPKSVIEDLLDAAGLVKYIGPSGYSSGSGVLSALIEQPTHICIMDELGRQVDSATKSGNSHKSDSHTMLMECFGRLHGTLRSQAFSNLTMNKKNSEAEIKFVKNPALTLMAMTTPSTLYESLSSKFVSDGFLNRFIIVESFIGRQVGGRQRSIEPSQRLLKWAKACSEATGASGNLSGVEDAKYPPEPVVVPFSQACEKLLEEIDRQCVERMDKVEGEMEEMFIRTKEIIQRVSLIVAVSCESSVIEVNHLEWAKNYVWHYANQAYNSLKVNLADNDFESVCQKVFSVIEKSGNRGVTDRDLAKLCRSYRGLPPFKRKEVMDALSSDYMVKKMNINHEGGGRPRTAWVYISE